MNLSISIKKTVYLLFGAILALNGFGLFLRVLTRFLGFDISDAFLRLFDTAEEANITAWFSSVLLLMAGALLLMIARIKTQTSDSYARHWNILAWVFFFLSMDEIVGLHEGLIEPLRNATDASGIFYFSWVLVAIPLLLLFGLFFLRFLLNLPRKTAVQIVVAGVIFVTGAVGFEMLGGVFHESGIYRAFIAVEETLENIGAGLFIVSLLAYARSNLDDRLVGLEIKE
jgi:hypothetical protein